MEDFTICEPDLAGDGKFSFFGVLDGHGGAEVAKYVQLHFPEIVKAMLKDLISKDELVKA